MLCLINVREETDSLFGLSLSDMPFSVRNIRGSGSLLGSHMSRFQALGFKTALVAALRDFDSISGSFPDFCGQYMIFPSDRGTAPLLALASLNFINDTILYVPSWHQPEDEALLSEDIKNAEKTADEGGIAVFGGAVCFRAQTMLDEMQIHCPELRDMAVRVYENRRAGHSTVRFCGLFMDKFDMATISDALLCKSERVVEIKNSGGLRSMDNYKAVYEKSRKDRNGNATLSPEDSFGVAEYAGARNNLVVTADRDITVLGVEGLVVADTGRKIIIARRDADIESLIKELDA